MKKAFSYNEILITVGIVAIISSMSAPFLLRFISQNHVDQTNQTVLTLLRSSQLYSIDAIDNSAWGVCMVSGRIIQYSGSCIPANYKRSIAIEDGINITGLTQVQFAKYTGELSANTAITISDGSTQNIISINRVGGYQID